MKQIQWNIVKYEPKYRNEVLQLMDFVQNHRTIPEEFIWWFENNPTKDLNIYLAVYNDKIIGMSCHNTFKMLIDGKEQIVTFPLNVITHPDYRGQGIFSKLELANEEHAKKMGFLFMLSFPNAVSTPIFLNRLGWKKIEPSLLYFRPLKCDALTKKSKYLTWALPAIKLNLLFFRDTCLDNYGLSTEEATEFGIWTDEIYEANKDLLSNCIVRSKEYLNWRFIQDPNKKYTLFKVKDGNVIVGYIVLGIISKKNLTIGYAANSLLIPDYHHLYFQIQNSFNSYHKSSGADLILYWGSPFYQKASKPYLSGYLPYPRKLYFIYKINSTTQLKHNFKNYRNWFFQLGDLDFF